MFVRCHSSNPPRGLLAYFMGAIALIVVYVVLGWMPILGIGAAFERLPRAAFGLFLGGGVLYTAGLAFLLNDHRYRYFHVVWHLFVMAASCCHFVAVLSYTW